MHGFAMWFLGRVYLRDKRREKMLIKPVYFWWFWFWMWISSKNYFVRFLWFLWFCLRAPIFHRVGRYIMEVAKYVVFSDAFLYVDYVVLRECLKPSRNKGIFELVGGCVRTWSSKRCPISFQIMRKKGFTKIKNFRFLGNFLIAAKVHEIPKLLKNHRDFHQNWMSEMLDFAMWFLGIVYVGNRHVKKSL